MIAATSLDETIGSFGSLVGLVLALITLFTGARDSSVRQLEEGELTGAKRRALSTEIKLSVALFVVTVVLVVAGAPLWIRTLDRWSWSTDHSIRWIFAIVWPLLVPLAAWQLGIARRAGGRAGEP